MKNIMVSKSEIYERYCTICEKLFLTKIYRQHICSKECRKIANKETSRIQMVRKRHSSLTNNQFSCVICGFQEVVDVYYQNDMTYILCPNHHALILRGVKTLNQLLKPIENSFNRRSSVDVIKALHERDHYTG